jgi:nitric oxide reductase NorD protein
MGGIAFEPWEPEETVGKLWHAYASRFDAPQAHEEAAVDLENIGGRLAVFFRGLGGDHAVQIKGSAPERSAHRLSLRRRLGAAEERLARTSFDGEALRLPLRIDALPSRAANEGLYFWLAAASVHAPAPASPDDDPLRADIRALQAAQQMTRATLAACPGLRRLHTFLMAEIRQSRRRRALPEWEAAVEAAIQHLLGGAPPQEDLGRAIAMLARGADRSQIFRRRAATGPSSRCRYGPTCARRRTAPGSNAMRRPRPAAQPRASTAGSSGPSGAAPIGPSARTA